MTHLKQLTDKPSIPNVFWYGEVASDPTDFNQKIDVLIPDFAPNRRWRGARWQARDSTSMPARGDKCVLVFDSRGDPWVIAWWPFFD